MITVTSMLCFRIPGSPQAASTRTGDSSVYRVYEAYVQGQDRLLCICQPQRLPPLTTEKTYRCLTSPREPRSCVHKKTSCVSDENVHDMQFFSSSSQPVHFMHLYRERCNKTTSYLLHSEDVFMNRSSGFSFRFYRVHGLVMNRFL